MNVTKNVSREGIYFVSKLQSYYEGMRLFLTVPYHAPSEPMDQEYLGQVARVDDLEDGKRGIGVQLLTSLSKQAAMVGSGARMK